MGLGSLYLNCAEWLKCVAMGQMVGPAKEKRREKAVLSIIIIICIPPVMYCTVLVPGEVQFDGDLIRYLDVPSFLPLFSLHSFLLIAFLFVSSFSSSSPLFHHSFQSFFFLSILHSFLCA